MIPTKAHDNPSTPQRLHTAARARAWRLLCALLLGATLSAPSLAIAKDSDEEDEACDDYVTPETRRDLGTLTTRGTACFDKKLYGKALKFYRQAFAMERTPLLEAAIGRTMHELGLWSTARSYYKRYLASDVARQDPANRQRILDRLVTLQKEVRDSGTTLKLQAAPTRTYVYLELDNGHRESLGATPMTLKLAPGSYKIIFEKRGYYPRIETISLDAHDLEEIEAELVPQDATFNIEARTMRRVGTTTFAFAVPVVVAGGILSAIGSNNAEQAQTLIDAQAPGEVLSTDRDALARANTQQKWGNGLLIIGSAAIVTGAVLAIVGYTQDGPPEQAKDDPESAWRFEAHPLGAQVGFSW